ncbi:MAG: MXAN_5808 family serine peptidase [Myxococcaceae bacterium]
MPRTARRVTLIAVLLGLWAFVGGDRAPSPVTYGDALAASPLTRWVVSTTAAAKYNNRSPHDLSSLRVLNKVILYVKDNYVDQRRVKPKEMMIAGLEYVEKTVPDVLVEGTPESGKVRLNVNGHAREFDISAVDSLWRMSFILKDVFEFIAQHMRPVEDTRDVEYAAVNGMLSTLDPHSVLLRPELYQEMKLQTKGEFGGLGMVLQTKEGNLNIVKVLPKTPAARANLRKDDHILKIGEESTVNMDLNEAVSKLRGTVDSKVTILISRPRCPKLSPEASAKLVEECRNFERPSPVTLSRAIITIESVQAKLLGQNVGYVRLKNFQGNTTRELQSALSELNLQAKGQMKGLVLDLRGNPGGLLEQAIQVSDLFLDRGTIVATVGLSDKLREEKRAHPDDRDLAYPMVVLVNAGSASASEIVAGALKNLNRAVVVGQQTFGKGSVQVLYDFPDDSALKLTIAKYLTPGDVSIQEVGVGPDIALIPTRVTPERINVFAPRKSVGEADLEQHFGNTATSVAAKKRDDVLNRDKPFDELRYLKDAAKPKESAQRPGGKPEKAKPRHGEASNPLLDAEDLDGVDEELYDQLDAEAQDEIKEDFEVRFARDLTLRAGFTTRDQMLGASKAFLNERRAEEQERISAALARLGPNWDAGPTPKNAQLLAALNPGLDERVTAGARLQLELVVENKGAEPLHRLRAWTESENVFLDRREFVFGALKPGEKKTWSVPIQLPKELASRRDDVTVRFYGDQGQIGEPLVTELNFAELPRPAFALSWQVQDSCNHCNADGAIQRGEQVDILVDVTNQGPGKALGTFAAIKNNSDAQVFIDKGRFKLGEIAPGETKTARFTLEVKRGYIGNTFGLKLNVFDEPLEELATEKLEFVVLEKALPLEAKRATVRLQEGAELFGAPSAQAKPLFKAPRGGTLTQLGRSGPWLKVEVESQRFAFVRESDAKPVRGKAEALTQRVSLPFRSPPKIALSVDSTRGGVVVEGDRFTLSGEVIEPEGLLDLYVLVNDQKVFFKTADTKAAPPVKLPFLTEFPLKEGNNYVVVVARETQDFGLRRVLVLRRRSATVARALGTLPRARP